MATLVTFCFPGQRSPSTMESALKGKNLLQREHIFSRVEKGGRNEII